MSFQLGKCRRLQSAAVTLTAADRSVSTVRTGDGFDVLIGGQARVHLAKPEKSYGVVTAAGPGHVAIIPDHDGSRGSRLMTYDTRTGRTRTLARGKVASAAFSPGGTRLACTVARPAATTGGTRRACCGSRSPTAR
ncbi:hypothetical protein DMB42_14810 [Nonomuraea sp. WAC 01424]|uniref:hypothetical protein n=1 Tax=Nonomuraea sp. WAC 01424 TaxID=2203200 RepID=UPI000F7A8743|nr:hypothetical protein [Nonomuraea sp. WAC 01424]RSN11817.1 hypothetical protein DMB42_14810 [Nonomuraea sp. WAC 01424]